MLLAALLWLALRLTRSEGAYVRVTVDGEIYGEYKLSEDAEIRIGDDESYNLLLIKDGEASVIEASCPDKLCVNMGWKSHSGESIICLPNRVVIEIRSGEGGPDVINR